MVVKEKLDDEDKTLSPHLFQATHMYKAFEIGGARQIREKLKTKIQRQQTQRCRDANSRRRQFSYNTGFKNIILDFQIQSLQNSALDRFQQHGLDPRSGLPGHLSGGQGNHIGVR